MDELFDPGEFLITFPLWFLAIGGKGATNSLLQVAGPGGEKATPLFTDQDLAERFRLGPLGHYDLAIIRGPNDLLMVLGILERKGFTHVTIDQRPDKAMFLSIGQLRSRCPDSGG